MYGSNFNVLSFSMELQINSAFVYDSPSYDAKIFTVEYIYNGHVKSVNLVVSYQMMFNKNMSKLIIAELAKEIALRHYITSPAAIDHIEGRIEKCLHGQSSVNENPCSYFDAEAQSHSVATASRALPGMDFEVSLELSASTCGCGTSKRKSRSLWDYIQHLNDYHKWTRERIADWIDEIHDKGLVNVEFEPWEDPSGT